MLKWRPGGVWVWTGGPGSRPAWKLKLRLGPGLRGGGGGLCGHSLVPTVNSLVALPGQLSLGAMLCPSRRCWRVLTPVSLSLWSCELCRVEELRWRPFCAGPSAPPDIVCRAWSVQKAKRAPCCFQSPFTLVFSGQPGPPHEGRRGGGEAGISSPAFPGQKGLCHEPDQNLV